MHNEVMIIELFHIFIIINYFISGSGNKEFKQKRKRKGIQLAKNEKSNMTSKKFLLNNLTKTD